MAFWFIFDCCTLELAYCWSWHCPHGLSICPAGIHSIPFLKHWSSEYSFTSLCASSTYNPLSRMASNLLAFRIERCLAGTLLRHYRFLGGPLSFSEVESKRALLAGFECAVDLTVKKICALDGWVLRLWLVRCAEECVDIDVDIGPVVVLRCIMMAVMFPELARPGNNSGEFTCWNDSRSSEKRLRSMYSTKSHIWFLCYVREPPETLPYARGREQWWYTDT